MGQIPQEIRSSKLHLPRHLPRGAERWL